MKSIPLKLIKKIGMLAVSLMALSTACKNGKAQESTEANKTEITEAKVRKPDTPLNTAVVTGNLDAVQQHIAVGTNLNEKDALSGSTPLITAITFGKDNIARALIDAGADLSPKNNDGSTALHVAAFFGRVEMVQALLDANADKTIRNNYGSTPRETVTAPFKDVKPIYDMLQQQLGPIGLQLNLEEIEKARPVIALMLQ